MYMMYSYVAIKEDRRNKRIKNLSAQKIASGKENNKTFRREEKVEGIWKGSVFQCQSSREMFKLNSFP